MKSPITYEDLHQRLFEIRDQVYSGLQQENLFDPDFGLIGKFEQDKALRQTVAEVLLTSILWVEAGQSSADILQNCVPEIKKLLIYASNLLLKFLVLKKHAQKEGILSRGSLPDAWTHLLVEFREALGRDSDRWLWTDVQIPYVANKYV